MAITGTPGGAGLRQHESEAFGNRIQVQQRPSACEQLVFALDIHGADVANVPVEQRLYMFLKILAVLDDACDAQRQSAHTGDGPIAR
ncbi:MAG: hypothetical protein WDO18_10715 [Acidobacteriota bacterium]